MTHIVFLSPENKDSRVQMSELADDIYVDSTKEHYHHVDIAEIPSEYDVESEGKKLASFLKTLKLEGSPANLVLVAYEDYAFVAATALVELKLSPKALLIVNFPLANTELLEWQMLDHLKNNVPLYLFQADVLYRPVTDYLRSKDLKAEIVRVEKVTNLSYLNSAIHGVIKKLID